MIVACSGDRQRDVGHRDVEKKCGISQRRGGERNDVEKIGENAV